MNALLKKNLMVLFLSCLFTIGLHAQHAIPVQARPFENVLISLKSDSVLLFKNAFSKDLEAKKIPLSQWKDRLDEGKRKFKRRYGEFVPEDFSYNYIDSTGQLQVFFKKKESFKILVIEENNEWKLKEH